MFLPFLPRSLGSGPINLLNGVADLYLGGFLWPLRLSQCWSLFCCPANHLGSRPILAQWPPDSAISCFLSFSVVRSVDFCAEDLKLLRICSIRTIISEACNRGDVCSAMRHETARMLRAGWGCAVPHQHRTGKC